MKKIAYDLGPVNPHARGDQRHYKCIPPMPSGPRQGVKRLYDYVVVSTVIAPSTGPETYIFGADEKGAIVDWSELEGSYRGDLDHVTALENAGYEVEIPE